MRVSEALRLGAMTVQATRNNDCVVFRRDAEGNICAACAIGTIAMAVGLHDEMNFFALMWSQPNALSNHFPILLHRDVQWPKEWPAGLDWNLGQMISGLFESARWTRERIADWVEIIECEQEARRHEVLDSQFLSRA